MAPFQVEIKWTTAHFPALPKLTSQQGLKWGGYLCSQGSPSSAGHLGQPGSSYCGTPANVLLFSLPTALSQT